MAVTPPKHVPKTDPKLLTEDDRARLLKQAAAVVEDERKKATEAAELEKLIDAERAKFDADLTKETVVIDLPAFADKLIVDGVYYYHQQVLEVTSVKAASLRNQMAMCWEHEHVTGNPNASNYKPVRIRDTSDATSGLHRF